VPTATCSSGDQYAAFWVGLDGYSSETVEQTGTDSDCVGKNPSYYAWYEFYPHPSFEISLTIKPGDHMVASVVYSGSEFTITIEDVTTGKSYTKSSTVSGAQRSSAEWIAEAPCCTGRGGILPLADFGTVLFGEDSTGIGGTNYATKMVPPSGPIGSFPASSIEQIMMATSGGHRGSHFRHRRMPVHGPRRRNQLLGHLGILIRRFRASWSTATAPPPAATGAATP
jgi:hypothetical protein